MKLYDTFYNTNGHLSIVYKITHNHNYYILNYNHGNTYYLTTGLFEYKEANISPEEFFKNFPVNLLDDIRRKEYIKIKNEFLQLRQNYNLMNNSDVVITIYNPHINKKLLLIL